MGYRLTKIYTKTGDKGTTRLGEGTQVRKDHIRIEAYGTIDECNSAIGIVLTQTLPKIIEETLTTVQHKLFDLGGELCLPGQSIVLSDDVVFLEKAIDDLNQNLPPLKNFILPGGGMGASFCHLARTICRRAERVLVTLHQKEPVNEQTLKYLNRLSDYLFVAARAIAKQEGKNEVLWENPFSRQRRVS